MKKGEQISLLAFSCFANGSFTMRIIDDRIRLGHRDRRRGHHRHRHDILRRLRHLLHVAEPR
jgi:hypothetical protein